MGFWDNKRVVVTGGSAFLGSHLVEKLPDRGCAQIFVPRSQKYDLPRLDPIQRMLDDCRPDIVIHLAARVGRIDANRAHPAGFFVIT